MNTIKYQLAVMFSIGLVAMLTCAPPVYAAGTLHRGTVGDPDSLDPQKTLGAAVIILTYDLFEGLMTLDPEGKVIPGIAHSYSMSEDGHVYTFQLRDDLKWSDGTPLTAEDIVYSFRRLLNPDTAAFSAPTFHIIANGRAVNIGERPLEDLGVSAIDGQTVEFTLERPVPYFSKLLSLFQSMPVPRHAIEQHGREWARPGNMVTNGAYMLTERMPQSYIRLDRNPHYHASDTVDIDSVYLHPAENSGTAFKRFRAGELDIVLNFPPERIAWIRDNMAGMLHVSPEIATFGFAFNTERAPFDDVRIRRALSLAIDRETIINRLLDNGVTVANSLVPTAVSNYQSQPDEGLLRNFSDRRHEAEHLLDEAGFTWDEPLKLTLSYYIGQDTQKIAVAVQGMWKEIGIDVKLLAVDLRALFKKRQTGDFDVLYTALFAGYDDPIPFLSAQESRYIRANNNPSRYSNSDYDELVARADRELDPEQRMSLLQEAERLVMQDHPIAPLYFEASRRLIHPKVQGWIDNSVDINLTRYLSLAE